MADQDLSLFHVLAWRPELGEMVKDVNKQVEGVNVILDTLFIFARSEDHGGLTEHFWTDDDRPKTTIALVNDHDSKSDYLYVIGPDHELVFDLWNNLRVMLPVVGVSELKAAARNASTDPGSLQRLAWGLNHKYDESSRALIITALSSPDRLVRDSAVAAVLILKWRSFLEPLREAETKVENPSERQAMKHVCRVVEERGVDDSELERA